MNRGGSVKYGFKISTVVCFEVTLYHISIFLHSPRFLDLFSPQVSTHFTLFNLGNVLSFIELFLNGLSVFIFLEELLKHIVFDYFT